MKFITSSKGIHLAGALWLLSCCAVVLAQTSTTTTPAPVLIQDYAEVTDARLLNPEPENWLIYKGSYSQQAYSPLNQITPDNVADLVPVWPTRRA